MKIVHLLTYYGNYLGGMQIYVKELAKRQKEEGHDVTILTAEAYGKERFIDEIKIIKTPILFSAFRVPFTPLLLYELIKLDCDVLHVHLPSPWIDLCSSLKKLLSPKTKLVLTIHNYLTLQKSFVEKLAAFIHNKITISFPLFLSDKIIISTKAFAKSLPYKIKTSKLQIIPVGVDLEKFKIENIKKKNQILFVGRLIPEKGFLNLMKAMSIVRKSFPKLKLKAILSNVYGFEDYKKKCLSYDEGFLETEYNVENHKISEYYNESKAFIFPSIGLDSFGIVLIEAMACGTPIISTDLPGPSSIVPSFAGETFERNDYKQLANKIIQLLNNKYDSKKINSYVKENFDWDLITKDMLEVYKE